jgi:hypothetical protein
MFCAIIVDMTGRSQKSNLTLVLLWVVCIFAVSQLLCAQTVVIPDGAGGAETFERPAPLEDVAQKMSWETVQLGDIKLDLPTTYEISLDRGEILGHPYFAKFTGRSYPDIFVMDTVFDGEIEDLANSFFRNYLQPRFQLRTQKYLSGAPRKLILQVQGMEMLYQVCFVSLNQRNAFLIFVVPVPPKTDYADSGEQIIQTVRLH